MRFFRFIFSISLILLGIYFLGKNIFFTTNVYPYWWRGISADAAILFLTTGTISLFVLPKNIKSLGWIILVLGIILIFMSSRVVLTPTSLWQFFTSLISITAGYQLLTAGKINI